MLPVRGATGWGLYDFLGSEFQSMLPVRGATDAAFDVIGRADISIHAPRAGSDPGRTGIQEQGGDFNPCSPCGERLFPSSRKLMQSCISIHAPRAGSDRRQHFAEEVKKDFNPCSPCGERRYPDVSECQGIQFQSMLPVRGATPAVLVSPANGLFQSMLPVRGATRGVDLFPVQFRISIHAPRAGSDPSRA